MDNILSTLNNVVLARLLMRLLWHQLDTGGVSHGRHYASRLLEEAIDLVPLPEEARGLYPLEAELFRVVDARVPTDPSGVPQMLLPDLNILTDAELAYLLLLRLQRLCEREQANKPNGILSCILRYSPRILQLLKPPDDLSGYEAWDAEALRVEASDRRFAGMEGSLT